MTAHVRPLAETGWRRALDRVGGPARMQVILVLAAALALDGADKGTVSATAGNLESAFGVGNTDIGLLVTASTLTGALMTIPVGALTDRVNRTRLLSGSVMIWGAAMVMSAIAPSYLWLLLSRIALGAVTATAGPTVASLTGDYFPAADRARMYGFILAGELVGTGIGFGVSGFIASGIGWRYAFAWLAIPSVALAGVVWRLAEPARGGQSRLSEGQEHIPDEAEVEAQSPQERRRQEEEALRDSHDTDTAKQMNKRNVRPYENQILSEDPADKSLWWAIKYVLRVRTDVIIIVTSALGYFYFAGIRTFAILFAREQYGVTKAVASAFLLVIGAGAIAGVFAGGRATELLTRRGVMTARVIVPAVVLLTIPIFLAPGFWTSTIWIAIPLLTIGAAFLGAANPPQDAARLDIIHPHLWGRSEGVRSALRQSMEAAGPLTFGFVSDRLFGGHVAVGGTGSSGAAGTGRALSHTFILFLVVLIIAGGVVLIALRTYPRDVLTADESVRKTLEKVSAEADDPQRDGDSGDDNEEHAAERDDAAESVTTEGSRHR